MATYSSTSTRTANQHTRGKGWGETNLGTMSYPFSWAAGKHHFCSAQVELCIILSMLLPVLLLLWRQQMMARWSNSDWQYVPEKKKKTWSDWTLKNGENFQSWNKSTMPCYCYLPLQGAWSVFHQARLYGLLVISLFPTWGLGFLNSPAHWKKTQLMITKNMATLYISRHTTHLNNRVVLREKFLKVKYLM